MSVIRYSLATSLPRLPFYWTIPLHVTCLNEGEPLNIAPTLDPSTRVRNALGGFSRWTYPPLGFRRDHAVEFLDSRLTREDWLMSMKVQRDNYTIEIECPICPDSGEPEHSLDDC